VAYLTQEALTARVGGAAEFLRLTDDDRNNSPDDDVLDFLLGQVDTIVDGYARRGGYTPPLEDTDVETLEPWLLDIANFKARTRGNGRASDEDQKLYDDAMKVMEGIADGSFKLPSFEEASPTGIFGFDSSQSFITPGEAQIFSRSRLRKF
jgi:phage gp36-like protein